MKRGGNQQSDLQSVRKLIDELHHYDCAIENELLTSILSHGDAAVPHLEQILQDALAKAATLDVTIPPKNTEWFAVVHALYLLGHLPSFSSLDLILRFLGQKQAVVDYWFQDLLDDDIWEIPFLLGKGQVGKLKAFVLNPRNNTFSRLAICTALVQLALHHESEQPEVRRVFRELLTSENDEPDFIGLVVSELMDWRDPDLKNHILSALATNEIFAEIITPEEISLLYQRRRTRKLTPPNLLEKYEYFRQHAYFASAKQYHTKKVPKLRRVLKTS